MTGRIRITFAGLLLPVLALTAAASSIRSGSSVSNVGDNGNYWSSSAIDENYAYGVSFVSSDVFPGDDDYRFFGYSVRLITDVK